MAALIKYHAGGIIIARKISAFFESHSNCFKIVLRCNYFSHLNGFACIFSWPLVNIRMPPNTCGTGLLQLLLHQQFLFVLIHF